MGNAIQASGNDKVASAIANAKLKFDLALEERTDELLDDYSSLLNPVSPSMLEQTLTGLRGRAHKLHGLAAMIGYARIGSLASKLENHIDLVLLGPRPLETEFIIELLSELLDEIEVALWGD